MAGKKNTAKLHHYVPQGYLRGFTTEGRLITAVPLDRSRKPFSTSVRNVAARTHFHTIEGLKEPDLFERRLSAVEGHAVGIIRRFEQGRFPPTESDRWALASYMAFQAVRGPDARVSREHVHAGLIRLQIGLGGKANVGDWIRENLGREPTPEMEDRIWTEATQPGGPPFRFSNLTHILDSVETAEHLTNSLALRPWILVRFTRRSVVTSDAPVTLIPDDKAPQWQGIGFNNAGGIFFPLTRKLILVMGDPTIVRDHLSVDQLPDDEYQALLLRGVVDYQHTGTTADEKFFNAMTAGSAREYVFHHPDDGKFVPENLPDPCLLIVDSGGVMDMEFDGDPWFKPRPTAETEDEGS